MKKIIGPVLVLCFLCSCNNKDGTPDVSGIKVDVSVRRFENDFFSIDTNHLPVALSSLRQKYPSFIPVFFGGVLGLPDSPNVFQQEVRRFLSANRSIYEASKKKYADFSTVAGQFRNSFRFVKYYFPAYALPKIITLVGPIDAMARMQNGDYSTDFLGSDFIGVSLQFYLGADFPLYSTQYFIDNVAPLYRSRRFEPEYIVPDAIKLIEDDLFPDKSTGRPLIEQMIEKGKRWWLLDRLMPATADSLKTGYTQKQLDWCKSNEGLIWNYILSTENSESIEPSIIQNYIGESPTTQGMPPAAPGNIGQWVGWQIVKKFAASNPSITPTEVMNMSARKLLAEAKYKPK